MWDFKAFSFRILHPDPFQAFKTPLFPVDDDLVQDVTEVLPGVSLTMALSKIVFCQNAERDLFKKLVGGQAQVARPPDKGSVC